MASKALFISSEVSVSNLLTMPAWMGVRTVQRAHRTIKTTVSRFEPKRMCRAVEKSQVSERNFAVQIILPVILVVVSRFSITPYNVA